MYERKGEREVGGEGGAKVKKGRGFRGINEKEKILWEGRREDWVRTVIQ